MDSGFEPALVRPRMDHILVSLPSTPESRGLFNFERLQSLKPGAGIVNVGRGSSFDYDALANRLALFFDNLRRYLDGEPLRNVVRPEPGY